MRTHPSLRLPALCALVAARVASADVVAFDEAISGDASNDRFAPTMITLAGGIHLIRGAMGLTSVPDAHDLDYITFTVPEGHRLESFTLRSARVGGAFSFIGIQAGPIITIPPDWTSVNSPLLGWAHFGSSSIGQDLLPEFAQAPGAVGFSGPLGSGSYALWIMELRADEAYPYEFALGVQAVPAPAALGLLMLGASLQGRRRR